MDWDTYKRVFLDFEIALHQGEIIAQTCVEVLKNYPRDLPPKTQNQLRASMEDVNGILKQVLERMRPEDSPDEENGSTMRWQGREPQTALFVPTLLILLCNLAAQREPFEVDFSKAIYSQQLTMAFAHFDAFLGDTNRVILHVNPSMLRKNKQISWEKLIDLGSWNALVEHLTETFVYDFGWLSAIEKLTFFEEKFGFDLQLTEDDRDTVTRGELLRHLVVHNGGRVSAEHISRVQDKSLKVGDQIPIDHALIKGICLGLSKACSSLFLRVSETFFKKTEGDLMDLPRASSQTQNTAPAQEQRS